MYTYNAHITTMDILDFTYRYHITYATHTRAHSHILNEYKLKHLFFYSDFSSQVNCLEVPGPGLSVTTRMIHQMALLRHFLYSQVARDVASLR